MVWNGVKSELTTEIITDKYNVTYKILQWHHSKLWRNSTFSIFYIYIQKSNNAFLKDSSASLASNFQKSPVESYMEMVWLLLMTALVWEACYKTSILNHTVIARWKDGSSVSHLLFCWHYCWHLKRRDKSLCKEGNTLPVVASSHLRVLKQPKQKTCAFWFMMEYQETLMQGRKSVCCKQFSNLRKYYIFYVFVN